MIPDPETETLLVTLRRSMSSEFPLEDLSSDQLQNLQLKVAILMRQTGAHAHDSQGGVGHHDRNALADLSWRLEQANPFFQANVEKDISKK